MTGVLTEEFNIGCGVRQGGIGLPVLFRRCVDEIIIVALKEHKGGTSISSDVVLNDLDYADDIDLIDNNAATFQALIEKVSMKAAEFGLKLNQKSQSDQCIGNGY